MDIALFFYRIGFILEKCLLHRGSQEENEPSWLICCWKNTICKGLIVETLLQNVADTVMSQAVKIQTSLYDLIATLNAELSPDEDNIVIAAVVHLLNTHRVTCTGALQGYRLACHDRARAAQLLPQRYGCFSQFESYGAHCERSRHQAMP